MHKKTKALQLRFQKCLLKLVKNKDISVDVYEVIRPMGSPILEVVFIVFMKFTTELVEFSFNSMMYRQIDEITMGSPLRLALANIFVGFTSSKSIMLLQMCG